MRTLLIGSLLLTTMTQERPRTVTFTVHGREFKFVNRCTHFPDCDLSRGKLVGSTVVCTCGWQYDLLTGRAINHPLARIEQSE